MASWQLRFLGPPRLQRDGEPVSLANAKGLAVLGYVAATRQPAQRDVVVSLLWPGSEPEAARKNLRNALWAVGRALGKGVVVSEGDRLALAAEAWVDVHAFEDGAAAVADGRPGGPAGPPAMPADALAAVAALCRGPFLDGLELKDAPDFELWLAAERDRLAARLLRVLAALAEARRRAGNWAGLADAARRALEVDPLHEPMHRALVEALARAGRRAEALRALDALRRALEDELGVAPLPETEALAAAVRAGTLGPPVRAASADAASAESGSRTAIGPFVGRRAELDALAEAAAEAAAAGGPTVGHAAASAEPSVPAGARVVALAGEAGIGKSRLWREAARRLPEGAVVAEARALESTRGLPFVPVVDLMSREPLARLVAPDGPLAPIWRAELARLLPDARPPQGDLPAPADLPPEEERRRLFEALSQVLRLAGGQPLALFVDDVHWADETTLAWLAYAVHRLRDAPLLVVVAYRPDEASARLRAQVADWAREGIARLLGLDRLDDVEADALLGALGAPTDDAPRLRALAGGNPLFLTELALLGDADVPSRLAGVVRARLDRLDAAARQVLQAAAVLEPDADFDALRRTAGRTEDETLDALDALAAAGILEEDGGRHAFAHPLVAAVVREDLGAARAAVLHRRAAEALSAAGGADRCALAGRIGDHLAAAGRPEEAAAQLALAGERALEQAAPAEAAALFERAADLDPAPGRRLDVARARVRLGDAAGAREAFHEAYDAFAAAGEARRAAEASFGLAGTYLGTGHPEEIVRWAERGLARLAGRGDPANLALGRILLAAGGQGTERSPDEAETHLLAAARLAREHDLPLLLAQSRLELGNLRARQGDLDAARAAYREALQLARAAGEPLLEALAHNNAAYHALLAADLADARAHLGAGLALAERPDLALARQWLYSTAGEVALAEERWDEAESWHRRALAEAEAQGNPEQVANARANLGRVERGLGRRREAGLLLAAAAASAARLNAPFLQARIALEQADAALARGDAAEAEAALDRAGERLAGRGYAALEARADALREAQRAASASPRSVRSE